MVNVPLREQGEFFAARVSFFVARVSFFAARVSFFAARVFCLAARIWISGLGANGVRYSGIAGWLLLLPEL